MGRRYSQSPSPRGYIRRYSSPSPRGGYRTPTRDLPTSLLVRNLRHDCRKPHGFGFVQYVDPDDAAEANYHMHGQILLGRELIVVFAEETRKKPSEMRAREHTRRRSPICYSRSPRCGRSYSPSPNCTPTYSRSPDYYSPPRRRHNTRSISPRGRRSRERSYSRSPYRSRSWSRSPARSNRSWSRSPEPY